MPRKKKHEEELIPEKTKRNIKKIAIIVGIAVIIFLIISFALGLQVKFVLQEQMTLHLTPLEKSITTTESPEITFILDIKRPRVCKTECELKLTDVSNNETLNEDSIYDVYNKEITHKLPIPDKGSGQKLFSYKVTCNNRKSTICSTSEKKYFKTSLISVNYELTEEEKEIKEDMKIKLEEYLTTIKENDILIQDIQQLLNFKTKEKVDFEERFDEVKYLQIKNEYLTLWEGEDYIKLKKIFSSSSVIKQNNDLKDLKKDILEIIDDFNYAIDVIEEISEKNYNEVYTLRKTESLDTDKLDYLKIEIGKTYKTLNSNSVVSFEGFIDHVGNLYKISDNISLDHTALKNKVEEEGINKLNKIETLLNFTKSNSTSCILMNNRTKEAEKKNNISLKIIDDKYSQYDRTILLENINNYFIFLVDNTTFNSTLNITNYDEILIINSSYILNPYYNNHCFNTISYNYSFNINKNNFTINTKTYFKSNISTSIQDNKPQCCVYGECSECKNNPTENYPIVFVHGHAISKENRPEQSHEALSKIQLLMEEEGFIDAGQIGESYLENIPYGDWGRFDAPITVRLSYYLLTYYDIGSYNIVAQKTDKIENYALRLSELISIVKLRTGKNKVNIVAHSMGGLVVREYERIFGDDDINLIITVGTPNKGIEGRVKRFCSITGSSRECKDMHNDSIFIKRLNSHIPEVPFYTIRATGCDMGKEDGDGVVLARNVPLDFATNYEVEGECTDLLQSNLHTRFIDPDLYPKTYETILGILSSE